MKIWYITDVPDLTPFARWIPDLKAATALDAAGSAKPAQRTSPKTPARQLAGAPVAAKPRVEVPHCGCDVLPWDDCVHTRAA